MSALLVVADVRPGRDSSIAGMFDESELLFGSLAQIPGPLSPDVSARKSRMTSTNP